MQRLDAFRVRRVVVRRAQAEPPAGQEDAVPAAFPPGPGRVVADHGDQLGAGGPAAQERPDLGGGWPGQVGDSGLAGFGGLDGELARQVVAGEVGHAIQVALGQAVLGRLVQVPVMRLAVVHEVDQHPAVVALPQVTRPQPLRPPVAAGHAGQRSHQPDEVRPVARRAWVGARRADVSGARCAGVGGRRAGVVTGVGAGAEDDLGAGASGDGAGEHFGGPALEGFAGADVGEPFGGGWIEHAVAVQDREDAVPDPGRVGHVPAPLPLRLLASPSVVVGLS